MKKFASAVNALVLCTAIGFGAIGSTSGGPRQSDVLVVHSKEMVVNQDSRKHFVIELDEVDGVKGLRKLISSSPYEEAYIYTPEAGLWFECGMNERIVRSSDVLGVATAVGINEDVFLQAASGFDELIVYHFHPLPYKILTETVRMSNWEMRGYLHFENAAVRAMPKYDDLETMVAKSNEFYKLKPEGRISFKICSEIGITKYWLSEAGKAYFFSKTLGEIGEYCHKRQEEFKQSYSEVLFHSIGLESLDSLGRKMAASLSDERVRVSYLPYREYLALNK
jgi:hypothetical protein